MSHSKKNARGNASAASSSSDGCPALKKRKQTQKIDADQKCPYYVGISDKSPHVYEPSVPEPDICNTILDHVGNTPLVRINKITASAGVECEVLAKCEFFNAGGSVKDRIGKRMVLDAEASGRIKPGDTLIEPTSGNTGIGLALSAAIRGYKMVITLPEKMSKEKVDVLKALGAEIYRTPTEAAFDSPDSHIGVAARLNKEIQNSHILDQYTNPSNPLAHYDGTAEEIYRQCGGKIDCVVLTAGTGGTIAGIARKLKEKIPTIHVVGVDPHGSDLALPVELNKDRSGYQVEGIGYDFIPRVLDRSVVDEWVKSEDKSSFNMSRRLIREEGLLCGGSSGSAMVAAIEIAKRYKKGQRVVTLLPDSVRNYMTKFLDTDWMVDNGFMEENDEKDESDVWLKTKSIADLKLKTPVTVKPSITCGQAIEIMKSNGFDQMPVVSEEVVGMVTLGNLTAKILGGRVKSSDPVDAVVYKQMKIVSLDTTLARLNRIFDKDHFALVVATQRCYGDSNVEEKKTVVVGVVTPIDVLDFVLRHKKQ